MNEILNDFTEYARNPKVTQNEIAQYLKMSRTSFKNNLYVNLTAAKADRYKKIAKLIYLKRLQRVERRSDEQQT